ncbi:MAG TPA: alanine--glyoxylate aminotransferase family protein [Polyangiaceae bacterium]|nr:alanine--glyoxylate aminotransferase family protein [Polyangiaceae bacterium]
MRVAELPLRVLMGPGPSPVDRRVLEALAHPTLGHLDPAFLALLDQLRSELRSVYGTQNAVTLPMSGTGSLGMETCLVNLLEPGDRILVGVNGVFGTRMCEVARRLGAEVSRVEAPWGRPLDPDDLLRAAKQGPFKLLAVVHAETSTGVLQDLTPLRAIADAADALLLVDTVTSLGGVPVDLDRHGVDATYSGTQKCLSCPPGLAPVSFSERAVAAVRARRSAVASWYMDLTLIGQYWGSERVYHHTAPINMLFALERALGLVLEETLPLRFERHRRHAAALAAGLEALGLVLPVPAPARLPPLTLVSVPDGVDEAAVRRTLLARHGLEIGGGLGQFAGKAWRIGLMGAGATRDNVSLCLTALSEALRDQGFSTDSDALAQAHAVLDDEQVSRA